jgi:hypothetical protein
MRPCASALACAQRANDVTAQANAHRALGRAYIYLNLSNTRHGRCACFAARGTGRA